MREIKFRAWHKKINEYLTSRNDIVGFWECVRLYCLSVEQYTGLKDKNGKEIYEGDILSFGGHGKMLVSYSIAAIDTCYGQGSYGTDSFSGFKISGYWGDIANSKVIGNIHENPELLK